MRKFQPISRISAPMIIALTTCVGMLVLPAVAEAGRWPSLLVSLNAQSGGDTLQNALYSGCPQNDPVFIHHSCGSSGRFNQEAGDGTSLEIGILLPLDEGLELELAGGVLSERFGSDFSSYNRPLVGRGPSQRFDHNIPFSLSSSPSDSYLGDVDSIIEATLLTLLFVLPFSVYIDLFGPGYYADNEAKIRHFQGRAQLFAHLNKTMRMGIGAVVHLDGHYKQALARVSQTIEPALGIRFTVDWKFGDYDVRFGVYLQDMSYDIEGLASVQNAESIGFTTSFYFD